MKTAIKPKYTVDDIDIMENILRQQDIIINGKTYRRGCGGHLEMFIAYDKDPKTHEWRILWHSLESELKNRGLI